MRFDRAVAEVSRLGHVNAAAAAGVMQLRCDLDRKGELTEWISSAWTLGGEDEV